ncbi:PAS domain S-box protein [uncultured Pseudomonas sp.]|uniref:PAS domain S-box protein n=1 Tax=uncultured Pseudomonas sp. TaxID=114707 RepID=UPI0025F9A066|nr:PAS domain S-box protein [uncultured Pseudomonas sp.]
MPISSPLASLLDTATDTALITLTAEGRIAQWCPEVARLLGWTVEDKLGEAIVGLLVPEPPADQWLALLERCQAQGLRHRDGQLVRLDLHLVPLRRASVTVGWLLHVWQAPPSRSRFATWRGAERDLPQRLQALGEWSRRLSGAPDLAALRLCATQALRELANDPQARLLLAAEAHEAPPGELRLTLGSTAQPLGYLHLSSATMDADTRLLLDQLALLLAALLERQRQQEQVRQLEQRLSLEQGLLASVLQQAPLGISITEAGSEKAVMLNDRVSVLLGKCPEGETLDERYQAVGALHGNGQPYAVDDYPTVRVLRSGQAVPPELMRYRRPDGSIRLLEVSSAPVRSASGEVIASVTLFDDVQQRVDAENALREHSARLASLINQAAVGICQTDAHGRLLLANRRYCELLGRNEVGVLEQTLQAQTHPDDRAALEHSLDVLRQCGESFKLDQRFERPDGSVVWVSLHGSPLQSEVGQPLSVSLVVVDLTQRKQAEAALHLSNQRFRNAVEAVQGVVWTTNANGHLLGEQPAWSTLTGQSYAQYQQEGWIDAVHPDEAPRTLRRWRLAVQQQLDFHDEHRLRCRDGQWRTFSVRALPVREGGVVREWVGVHTDVSEIRMAEHRLRRLAELLEQRVHERTVERDRMWRVADDLLGVIQGQRWLSRNPAWGRALGWDDEELRHQPPTALEHPEDEPVFPRLAALRQGEVLSDLPGRLRTRDGHWRHMVWKATADHDGRIYVFGRDITTEHEASLALQNAEAALRQAQKMEAIGHLTGGIAHDFNNLLTGISGSLELLRRRLDQGRHDNLQRYLDTAEQSATRAAALTHRLLAFARRQTLDPRPVDVNALILSLEELFQRTLGERISLRSSLAPNLPPARTDTNQLENALLNLVINARDAMPEGGRLALETALDHLDELAAEHELPAGDYVRLTIADTGSGMPAEVVDRAFDPFFTTKPIGQGTGLGLSMLYGFIKQSGGHVSLESAPGAGTRVSLWLPCAELATQAPANEPQAAIAQSRGERLLLVEDDVSVRLLLREMLSELGYRVRTAATASAALSLVDGDLRYDLLITDVGLPDLDGGELAARLRERWPRLPVLFVSGHAERPTPNGEPSLAKPFQIDALARRLRQLLD